MVSGATFQKTTIIVSVRTFSVRTERAKQIGLDKDFLTHKMENSRDFLGTAGFR